MTIGDYLSAQDVVFLDDAARRAAIEALIRTAGENDHVPDVDAFSTAIFERESILSTGVGSGVAVPHAKLPGIEEFFVVVGVSAREVEWDAPDKKPVRIVFLIGGPADQQTKYLQLLAKIMLVVKNDALRRRLLEAASPEEVISTFSGM
jgi:PTS system nitrogen regulatory IIA component